MTDAQAAKIEPFCWGMVDYIERFAVRPHSTIGYSARLSPNAGKD
jgi:hypothetical protein